MNRDIIGHFDQTWKSFDEWFESHQTLYQSELAALKRVVPSGVGLEIGVGTGRFAAPLQVRFGLEPAMNMLILAKKRGILCVQGLGESLPFKKESFDFVQIVFVLEFVEDLFVFLREAARTLKKHAALILGFIDKDSEWGRYYAVRQSHRVHFHPPSPREILNILKKIGVEFQGAFQTLNLRWTSASKRSQGAVSGRGIRCFQSIKI